MNQNTKINAKGKILGRIATEISILLRSKNEPDFAYNKLNKKIVIVYNAKDIIVTGNKEKNKKYFKHTGYLGNLKTTSYEEMYKKNPNKILYKAVKNMLPKNRLQKNWLKNLKIYNGEIND